MRTDNKTRWKTGKIISITLLSLMAILLLFPIVLTFLYSFFPVKEMNDLLGTRGNFSIDQWMDFPLSPSIVSLRQYYSLLIEKPIYLQYFMNSVFYAVVVLLFQAMVLPALSYALSCFKFFGREALFFLILLLMLMPFQVTMAPSVLTMKTLGLLNTRWAIILPLAVSPLYVFLIRQYMLSIPTDILEAGLMDGAGTVRTYLYIVLPACAPILGAACALSFADSWNLVEQPLIYLSELRDALPLSVMFNAIGESEKGVAFAGAALYILPAMLIYIYFQEDILTGIQLSDLK